MHSWIIHNQGLSQNNHLEKISTSVKKDQFVRVYHEMPKTECEGDLITWWHFEFSVTCFSPKFPTFNMPFFPELSHFPMWFRKWEDDAFQGKIISQVGHFEDHFENRKGNWKSSIFFEEKSKYNYVNEFSSTCFMTKILGHSMKPPVLKSEFFLRNRWDRMEGVNDDLIWYPLYNVDDHLILIVQQSD